MRPLFLKKREKMGYYDQILSSTITGAGAAAGIRGVLDAASKREMAILRRLAKGMTEIGNKIIAMNAVFLSEKEVIRVTNKEFIS